MKPEEIVPVEKPDQELAKKIGQRLSDWRLALGYDKPAAFSQLLGLNKGVLNKYEGGINIPGGAVLATFSVQGLNINWLLTGEGEMFSGPEGQPVQVPVQQQNSVVLEDKSRLVAALGAVEEGLKAVHWEMPPDKKAELVLAAYELLEDSTEARGKAKVIQFIRAFSASNPFPRAN